MADHTIILENEYGRVVISPFAGASLRSLQVVSGGNQFELISGGDGDYNPRHVESGTGSFIMAPWPNRITDGKLYMNGEVVHTLLIGSDRHAQHGTVRRREWSVQSYSETSAQFAVELLPPWPFPGHLEYEVKLEGSSLVQSFWPRIAVEVTIRSGSGGTPGSGAISVQGRLSSTSPGRRSCGSWTTRWCRRAVSFRLKARPI